MRFQDIELPLELFKQANFADRIQKINQQVYEHADFLKQLIDKNHHIYKQMLKEVLKLVPQHQKKIKSVQNPINEKMLTFIKSMLELAKAMENQVSKNMIFLGSKKNDGLSKMGETIKQKLNRAGIIVKQFMAMSKQYNAMGKSYVKKCDYFNGIENDPIKFYSLKRNAQKYSKIINLQEQLEKHFDKLLSTKNQIRIMMMIQLSLKITQYYEGIRVKLDEYRRIVDSTREKIAGLLNGVQIGQIQEVTEEEYSSINNVMYNSTPVKENSIKNPLHDIKGTPKQKVKMLKKQKIHLLEQFHQEEQTFLTFLSSLSFILANAEKQLISLEHAKDFSHFSQQKLFISEFLPPRCLQDIDSIILQQRQFQNIFFRVREIINPKIFSEKFRYRRHIYERFFEEMDTLLDQNQDQQVFDKELQRLIFKFEEAQRKNTAQIRDQIGETSNRVYREFAKKSDDNKSKASKKMDLFSKKYFEILKNPFFDQSRKIFPFKKSQFIRKYQDLQQNKRIKKMGLDLNSQKDVDGRRKKNAGTCCCGIIRKNYHHRPSEPARKKKKIDSYLCALKSGFLLIQGSMSIYEEYLRFKSYFNPDTIFGSSSDIQIPCYDILQIIRGRHIMSLLVTIVTKHGNIQLTSFVMDPIETLKDTYRNSLDRQNYNKNLMASQKSQVTDLLNKFRTIFVDQAQREDFKIINVKATKSDGVMAVEYKYVDQISNGFQKQQVFMIKMSQFDNALEYVFWHSDRSNGISRKRVLQNLAKNIINQDRIKRADTLGDEMDQFANLKSAQEDKISFQMSKSVSSICQTPRNQQALLDTMQLGSFMNQQPIKKNSKKRKTSYAQPKVLGSPINSQSAHSKHKNVSEPIQSHRQYVADHVLIRQTSSRQIVNESENKENVNKTNSYSRIEHSINSVISEQAPTVKHSKKKNKGKQSQQDLAKQEGLKKILLIVALIMLFFTLLQSFI